MATRDNIPVQLRYAFMPQHPVSVLAHSTYEGCPSDLITVLLPLPTCLLAELRTHRTLKWTSDFDIQAQDFSINANSDRAIPIEKKIEQIKRHPYFPIPSLANKGMSGIEMMWPDEIVSTLMSGYQWAMEDAIAHARRLIDGDYSKQIVNRLLMPFSWSSIVVTGTQEYWDMFFALRTAAGVDPSFRAIAEDAQLAISKSTPVKLDILANELDNWHIAFSEEIDRVGNCSLENALNTSASCCARLSFDIERDETQEKHNSRAGMCKTGGHYSVFEHQATPNWSQDPKYESNLRGWILYRKILEMREEV